MQDLDEMNFDIVKSYFKFIHNYISDDGYFLNINRYEKTSVDIYSISSIHTTIIGKF